MFRPVPGLFVYDKHLCAMAHRFPVRKISRKTIRDKQKEFKIKCESNKLNAPRKSKNKYTVGNQRTNMLGIQMVENSLPDKKFSIHLVRHHPALFISNNRHFGLEFLW